MCSRVRRHREFTLRVRIQQMTAMALNSIVLLSILLSSSSIVLSEKCSYEGRTYSDKQIFAANDSCNICVCVNGSIWCTEEPCQDCFYKGTQYPHHQYFNDGPCTECFCYNGTSTCEEVCQPDCHYRGQTYSGGSTIPSGDSCNHCVCVNGIMQCTNYDCTPKQECMYNGYKYPDGAQFSGGPCQHCYCINGNVTCDTLCQPESCYYRGKVYSPYRIFPAGDGCNNCTCIYGEVVCTHLACTPAIELIFVNNTPVMREDSVYVEFESSPRLPGLLMQCHITRLDRDIRDYCSKGTYSRTGLAVGAFTLRIVAFDPTTGNRLAILRSRLWAHGQFSEDPYCTVYLINRGWRAVGDTFTVEFTATGPCREFQCSLNQARFTPCISPFKVSGLSLGRHHIQIKPHGCGHRCRPWRKTFFVEMYM